MQQGMNHLDTYVCKTHKQNTVSHAPHSCTHKTVTAPSTTCTEVIAVIHIHIAGDAQHTDNKLKEKKCTLS